MSETGPAGPLSRLWEKRWTILKLSIGVGLLVLVASAVDWSEFWRLIRSADPAWLAGLVLLVACDRVYMAGKWRYLLRAMRVEVPMLSAVGHYLVGGLVGTAVQWQLGGDIARATRASRETGEGAAVVGSVLIEKVVGLASVAALAVLALVLLNLRIGFAPTAWLGPAAAVAVPLLLALPLGLSSRRVTGALAKAGGRLPGERAKELASRAPRLRHAFDDMERALATFTGLTLVEQLVPVASLMLLTRAYGDGVPFVAALSVMPVVSLLSRLPISLESIGVKEGLYVFFLGLIGFTATEAFALAITTRVVDICVILGGTVVVGLLDGGGRPAGAGTT